MLPPPSPPSLTYSKAVMHVSISAAGTLPPLVCVSDSVVNMCIHLNTQLKYTSEIPVVMTCAGLLCWIDKKMLLDQRHKQLATARGILQLISFKKSTNNLNKSE